MLRQRNILPEGGERGALTARIGRLFSAALERRERRGHVPAQRVELFEKRFALRRGLSAEAVRVLPPGLGARPCRAAQRPEKNIVFQRVAVGAGNAGQTGFEIGEYAFIAPAVREDIERRGDERRERAGKNIGARACIERHAGAAARLFQRSTVILKAAHRNGNIPPATGRFTHEPPHLRRGQFALRRDAGGAHEPDGAGGAAYLVRPAEKVFLEKRHRRALPAARHGDDLCGHAVLGGGVAQRARRAPCKGKHLAAGRGIVAGETDRHVRQRQKRADDAPLLRGEVRKAVNIKFRAAKPCAVRKLRREHIEPPGGVGAGLRGERVERLLQQREIAQLVRERGGGVPGGFAQRVGRGAAEMQLVKRREKLYHLLRRAGAAAIDGERAAHLLKRERELEKPTGLVHVHAPAPAAANGDAVGKA